MCVCVCVWCVCLCVCVCVCDFVGTNNKYYLKQVMQSVLRSQSDQTHVHQFTGGDSGKKQTEAQHINKDSSTVSGHSLFYICYWSAADGNLADATSNIWTHVTGR
jgi:hypothetical protein